MRPPLTPKEEYVNEMKVLGLADPEGLYEEYYRAYMSEAGEWFDTHILDPSLNEIELFLMNFSKVA